MTHAILFSGIACTIQQAENEEKQLNQVTS